MKKRIIFLLCCSSFICFGQADSIAGKGIILGVNAGTVVGSKGFGAYSNFTMEKGHSHFEVGPVFGSKKNLRHAYHDYYFYSGNFTLTGLNAIYQISLNPKRKIFQSYFQNEFFFHYFIDNNTTEGVYTNLGFMFLPTAMPYKAHQTILGDFLGWGFKVKFLKNFYINQSAGFGMEYYSSVLNYEDISYNRKDQYFKLGVVLKLGLGYKFDYKLQPSADISFVPKDSNVSKKIIFGVSLGAMNSLSSDWVDYTSQFTIEKGKNFFSIGPVIGNKMKLERYGNNVFPNQYHLTGFDIVYQFTPKQKRKVVRFYFQNEFIFLDHVNEGIDQLYILNPADNKYSFVDKPFKSHQTDIAGFIGFGLKVKFLKNFYFNQSFGIGITHYSLVADYEDVVYSINESYTESAFLLKVGFGYTFANKLK